MGESPPLHAYLAAALRPDRNRSAAVAVIEALSRAAVELAETIAAGPLADITGTSSGVNPDGDSQRDIDLLADRLMRKALRTAPVASVLSEEVELPEDVDSDAPLCVAIDPLDGSANLENNISVGTIFSIRPRGRDSISTFFEPGTVQCARLLHLWTANDPGSRHRQACRFFHSGSSRGRIRLDQARCSDSAEHA